MFRTVRNRGLKLLSVWLTPEAQRALAAAKRQTNDSEVDVVNRALQLYALATERPGPVVFLQGDERVEVQP